MNNDMDHDYDDVSCTKWPIYENLTCIFGIKTSETSWPTR